jgi:ATP-binding cassette, subfamily B, bacterial
MPVSIQSPWTLLLTYLRPYKARVTLLIFLLLATIGLQLIGPQLLRRFLDAALAGEAMGLLVITAVIFFIVTVSQKILNLLTVYWSEDLGWSTTNRLRADLTRRCLQLDMSFHKTHTPGELIERIDGDVSLLAEYFSALIVHVLSNSLLLLGILALLFREDWRFGLIGLTYTTTNIIFLRLMQRPQVNIWQAIRQGYANLFSYLEERLTGTEDIRANGGEAHVLTSLYPLTGQVADLRARSTILDSFTFSTSYMLYILAWIATLFLAAHEYRQGNLTIGAVYLLAFYVGLLETPLKGIRRQMEGLQRALAGIGRIADFFQIPVRLPEEVTATLPDHAPAVQFDRVAFTYRDYEDGRTDPTAVLTGISFHLPAGRVLGLLGRTGSGKTTLTRLLTRLYDVDSGAITLDGIDVRHVALADLRRQVGMVTQDVQLFAATVRDNLTLFNNYDPDAAPLSDEQLLAALATLGLREWFDALPDGLDTMLAGSQSLSAGEAQLLAFTRLFLRDPRLIILDEASSRLDPATEQLLERVIDRLLHNRTAIIIAHRLETVQRVDEVLILEDGRIREYGSRQSLAQNPDSRFAHLLAAGLTEVLV